MKRSVLGALALAFLVSCDDGLNKLTSVDREASTINETIAITAGNNQIGVASTQLPKAIKFVVRDASSAPIPNAKGTIVVTSGGGTVSKSAFRTKADGSYAFFWTLGASGSQSLAITLNGNPAANAVANATVIASNSDIVITAGNAQTALPGDTLALPVRIRFTDASGNPLVGVPVSFQVRTGGGGVRSASLNTNSDGRITNAWALGWESVNQTMVAKVPGVDSVFFNATANVAGYTLDVFSGNNQTGAAGQALGNPISVIVKKNGVAVQNAAGKFEVIAGGGSVSRTAWTTNAAGRATVTWTLGYIKPNQQVKATVGAIGSLAFNATATGGYDIRNMSAPSRNHVMSRHVTGVRTINVSYEFKNSTPNPATTAVFLAPRVHADYYTPSGGQVYCGISSPYPGHGQTHTVNCTITVPFAMPAGTYDLFYTVYAPGNLSGFVTFETIQNAVVVDATNPLRIDSISVSANSFPPFTVDKKVTARMGATSSQGIRSLSASLYVGASHQQSCVIFDGPGSTVQSVFGGCVLSFFYGAASYDIRYIATDQAGNTVEQWMINAVTVVN